MLNSGSAIRSFLFRFAAAGESPEAPQERLPKDRMEETAAFRPPRRSRVRSKARDIGGTPRKRNRERWLDGSSKMTHLPASKPRPSRPPRRRKETHEKDSRRRRRPYRIDDCSALIRQRRL